MSAPSVRVDPCVYRSSPRPDAGLADDGRYVFHWDLMQRANRPTALVLLLMAVLCSPAGVCVIDGMAATVQAAAPAHAAAPTAHAHACCKSGNGTFLAANDGPCCSERRTGFVNVFRFTLHKQALPAILDLAQGWLPKTFVTDRVAFARRAPVVLRI